jgi:hypothetical protein
VLALATRRQKKNKRVCWQLRFKRLLDFIKWEGIAHTSNILLQSSADAYSPCGIRIIDSFSRSHCVTHIIFLFHIFSSCDIIFPVTGMTRFNCTSFGYLFNFAITEIQICLPHVPHQTTHKPPQIYFRAIGRSRPMAIGQ